jgi:Mrr N-terminal domain
MSEIRQRKVLERVLLTTLAQHPEGVSLHDAYDAIDRDYSFHPDWYRQIPAAAGYDRLNELGIADWRTVPQEQLVEMVATEPQWQNELRWARNELRKQHYLDMSAGRGTWKLTPAGMAAARQVQSTELTPEEKKVVTLRRPAEPGIEEPSIIGRRAKLLTSLDHLTHSMPLADLALLVDIARAIRRRGLADAA